MTLGLPGHLARDSLSRTFARAGHCAAWVCLGVTAVVGVSTAVLGGDPAGWTGATMAVVLAILLGVVARYPTVTLTLMYLAAGTAGVLVLAMAVMDPGSRFQDTNNVILALPMIALLLVGGAGTGSAIAITWAALGYGLSEAAAFLGATLVGAAWSPNAAAATVLTLVVVIRALDGISRRSDQRRETGLHRASQQTRELAIRHDYELRATARLHDTALSHLVAIAAAGSGPVDERLRIGIRQDLGLIVGRDWAVDHAPFETAENGRGRRGRSGRYAESDAARLRPTSSDPTAADEPGAPAFPRRSPRRRMRGSACA